MREVLGTLALGAETPAQVWNLLDRICFTTGRDFDVVAVIVTSPRAACVSFGRGFGRQPARPGDEVRALITPRRYHLRLGRGAVQVIAERGERWCAAHGAAPGTCRRPRGLTEVWANLSDLEDGTLQMLGQIFEAGQVAASALQREVELAERLAARGPRAGMGQATLPLLTSTSDPVGERARVERRARRQVADLLTNRRLIGM
jgi:hypothetical protein